MMSLCSVRGCRSDPGRTDSSVTFHPFPAERAAAERWARLCGVSDQECSQLLKDLDHGGTGRYQLCSLHFEEQAFETNTDNETCNVKLRPGAEPTLLLSPAPTVDNRDQVNPSSPAGPQRRTPPSASSSCTCGQSKPQTSTAAQGPDCGKSSRTKSRPQVSHCPSGATVVSTQSGVSQIVLNFSEEEKGLTLGDVSAESSARCPGGRCCCRCPQRVVKQVVLIFLDRPRESHAPTSSPSSQEQSPTTLSSSTQTEGSDGKPKNDSPIQPDRAVHRPLPPRQTSHQEAVHTGTQTEESGTCMEVSGVQGSPEDMESTPSSGEVPTSPGERICTPRGSCDPDRQTPESIPEDMENTPSSGEVPTSPGERICTPQGSSDPDRKTPESIPEDMESTPSSGEVPTSPGERICTPQGSCDPDRQTPESIQEPMQAVICSPQSPGTRRQDDVTPPPPDKVQPPPESLDQESQHGSPVTPSAAADSHPQDDDRAPGDLRRCDRTAEPPPCPHCRPTCRPLCLDPSINQYVGDLLEQYNVPPPPCISASSAECSCISASSAEGSRISASSAKCTCISSSAKCSCISASSSAECSCISSQRGVKQIVVNIVEQQRAAVSQDVSAPCAASESSSPEVASRQHQETQTCDDILRRTPWRPKEKPKSLPPRPPKSQSCPPLIITTVELSHSQEEEDIPAHAMKDGGLRQDMGSSLESKVTFEDVAVYFSKEEWELLGSSEKDLYREVMSDNYRALLSLGLLREKPDLVLRMENEEENLWVIQESHRRIRHCEEDLHFLESDMDGVRVLAKDADTSPCSGRESVESSSHLGALMRLVNEIPGFLLGSSVTDGSCSPARSAEDHGSSRTFLEVKTEEHSPACSPASSHLPLSETPEITAGLGAHRITEQRNSKIVTKSEKTEGAVSQSPGYSTTVSHLPVSLSCVKSDPGGGHDSVPGRLHIKQEEFSAHPLMGRQRETPPMKPVITHLPQTPLYGPGPRQHLTPDYARRPPSGGGTPLRRSAGASPRNSSVSPASASPGANCTGPGDLKIKIKQEDSGSEREMAESPVYGRKAHHSPASSFSTSLQAEREHWRLAASPLRSPADVPPGSSPLHRLVNCLKEISGGRPRPYSGALSTTRWGLDMSRVCADSSGRANREPPVPAPQPNPFTVAVTNGAAQLRESQGMRGNRDDLHMSNVPLSALGKCLEKIHSRVSSGQNIGTHPNTAELGVKRTHSDDLSGRPGVYGGAKRPALEASSCSRVVSSCSPGHRDLWRPPEELPRAPSEDQPIGNSHLMSVMNCVRKIPGCRPSPSIQVTSMPDGGRTCAQGVIAETKGVKVKQEKDDNLLMHPPEASKQWLPPPPQSPDAAKQSGPAATNVHLTGLMKLMEEIPCTESTSSSRAMYSIAVGHSLARRLDRSNYLSCQDDPSFQADLNDSTIASVDSVYSDDTTSWSSENVGPSYSAIGGLQRVVSEFAELGSVSPLVAVAAPPVSSVQDGIGMKKPKEASSVSAASTPRLMESVRRSPREAVGVSSSACSAENGEAAFAALCGLQKVVHGFVEQECVSPMSAVRNSTPTGGLRDCPVRKTCPEEEAASPHRPAASPHRPAASPHRPAASPHRPAASPHRPAASPYGPASSPAPLSRFLCDAGKWLPEPDSSYSALSGLQKVVNGFSEMSCVSPFSAVSTPVSEGTAEGPVQRRSDTQAPDCVSSPLTGQKIVINGVPDAGCLSPLTVASNVSSESDAAPAAKRRCERRDEGHDNSEHSHSSSSSRAPSSHCIDLTQEEEPACGKNKERRPKTREGPPLIRNKELPSNRSENPRSRPPGSSQTPSNQLIDLTEEDEALTKPKVSHSEPARRSGHTVMGQNPPPEKHRPSMNFPKAPSGRLDRPLDPGASGSSRGAVPAVNEHLSGLEKLLKGVPTFTPANRPSGQQQAWSGGWWFKSTSPHET